MFSCSLHGDLFTFAKCKKHLQSSPHYLSGAEKSDRILCGGNKAEMHNCFEKTGSSVFNQVASCLCAASRSETNGSKGLLQASFKCSVETLSARMEHSILLHSI